PPETAILADADYVEDAPENFSNQDFWRWVREATNWNISVSGDNPLSNSWAYRDRRQWAGGGLPVFHDLASNGSQSAHFSLSLRRVGRKGLVFHSQSAAETYFRRPELR